MFGKWFDSAYTGSMAGAGADVFAVMAYAVSHTWDAVVELNPTVVAGLIGMPVENVEKAIEFLCQPDPKSRNPEHEGRRLIYQSGHKYQVVSQPIYRDMRDMEGRRAYLRVKQQEFRDREKAKNVNKRKQPSTDVNTGQHSSTQSETETEVTGITYPLPVVLKQTENAAAPGGFSSLNDEATHITRAVVEETALVNTWDYTAIHAQARNELKNTKHSPDQIKTGMVKAWQEMQRCEREGKLRRSMSAQRFFSEGRWKDWKLWGLKKGETAWS